MFLSSGEKLKNLFYKIIGQETVYLTQDYFHNDASAC